MPAVAQWGRASADVNLSVDSAGSRIVLPDNDSAITSSNDIYICTPHLSNSGAISTRGGVVVENPASAGSLILDGNNGSFSLGYNGHGILIKSTNNTPLILGGSLKYMPRNTETRSENI
jgi:hypothetical protein